MTKLDKIQEITFYQWGKDPSQKFPQKALYKHSVSEQLELAFELQPSPSRENAVDWQKKWLVDFNAGKTQVVLFDRFNNAGAIDVKMDVSVLKGKSS